MCIFAQHTIQTMAPSRRQDFAPVMFAYGCKPVGIEDTAFQKVQSSKKFDSAQGEKGLRQICERKIEPPETTLVSHVMNRQHSLERQPLRIHKYRYERCGPIVHMQNLHLRRQPPR